MKKSLQALLREYFRGLGGEPAVVLCGACAALVVSHHQGSTSFFRSVFGKLVANHPAADALPYFWWFGMSLLLYVALPLSLSYVFRGSFTRGYGVGLGDVKAGLAIGAVFLAVMVPAVVVAAKTQAFAGAYPLAGAGAYKFKFTDGKSVVAVELFVLYELAYFLYFVGWEFLFRGWMLNGLLPTFGQGAVLVQMVPFALMHLGKPEAEALGSIVAGVALGVLALRTRSFWYGAVLHGTIAVTMDLLAAWTYVFPPHGPP